MTAQRGDNLILYRDSGGSNFVQVAALRSKTVNINGNAINTTTDDDVDGNNEIWNTYITGPKDFSVEGEGITKSVNQSIVQSIYNDFATGATTAWQVEVPLVGTFEANMIIDSMSWPSSYDDVVTFSITLRANSAPTFTAA